MKSKLKNILKFVGLYKIVYNNYIKILRNKYANINLCNVDLGVIKLQFDTSDQYSKRWFFPRFSNGKIHEPGATKIFIENIKDSSIVFDIGAHLGYFSCIAAKLSKKGVVYAFEVDSNCICIISNNLKINNLTNVQVNNLAVSDICGHIHIPAHDIPNPGIRISTNKGNGFNVEVPSITMDQFIMNENIFPDFIKIDVEGAEFKVLKGMKNLLLRNNLILLVEIHVKQLLKFFNTDYRDVLRFLHENGFKLEIVESHRTKENSLRQISFNEELGYNVMVLCSKSNI